MSKYKSLFIQLGILFIITVPAIFSLFKAPWFSVHDDQHIARLFLLDSALKQGYIYPRWVDTLGFGFGYPLFNFYPPLIYYISEIFHLVGFSLITSIKLMITIGYFLAATGMYFFSKKYIGKAAGFVSALFYTYFTYHAIVVYVRGALAEFFIMAILPFVFLTLHNLLTGLKLPGGDPAERGLPRGVKLADIPRSAIYFGFTLALLILTHPLIALPTLFFLGFFFIFYLFSHSGLSRILFIKSFISGFIISLCLSAFFWLPSLVEKKHTLVDSTLTMDLANYKLHYIFPQQLWYSPWGYGGSAAGLSDGMSFQLGKVHIGFALGALILYLLYRLRHTGCDLTLPPRDMRLIKSLEMAKRTSYFTLSFFCLLFSIFMSTPYSSFIWDSLSPLWYIQFPWRFHTFSALFISLCSGYFLFLLTHLFNKLNTAKTLAILALAMSFLPVFFYQKYFSPQRFIYTNDAKRTTFKEIAWPISRSSYDFVPKGVKTTRTELGTIVVDITKDELIESPYTILNGRADVTVLKNNFNEKVFQVNATGNIRFQLNTYNFPGWHAFLTPEVEEERQAVPISESNPYKLITVNIPKGNFELKFQFEDTPVRTISNYASVGIMLAILYFIFRHYRTTSAK